MSALQQEIETFNRLLPGLLAQVGKYALIKGDKLVDTFDTYGDAMKHGYGEFKLEPFMVKQIAHAEENDVRGAYNNALYLAPRTKMLQEWADWLDKPDPSLVQG